MAVPALPSCFTWGLSLRVLDTTDLEAPGPTSGPAATTCRSSPTTLHDEEPAILGGGHSATFSRCRLARPMVLASGSHRLTALHAVAAAVRGAQRVQPREVPRCWDDVHPGPGYASGRVGGRCGWYGARHAADEADRHLDPPPAGLPVAAAPRRRTPASRRSPAPRSGSAASPALGSKRGNRAMTIAAVRVMALPVIVRAEGDVPRRRWQDSRHPRSRCSGEPVGTAVQSLTRRGGPATVALHRASLQP
jgi:hypothetical protein